jgi:hypothetical protein
VLLGQELQLEMLPVHVLQLLLQLRHWFIEVLVLARVPLGHSETQEDETGIRYCPLMQEEQLELLVQVAQGVEQPAQVFAAALGKVPLGQVLLLTQVLLRR